MKNFADVINGSSLSRPFLLRDGEDLCSMRIGSRDRQQTDDVNGAHVFWSRSKLPQLIVFPPPLWPPPPEQGEGEGREGALLSPPLSDSREWAGAAVPQWDRGLPDMMSSLEGERDY